MGLLDKLDEMNSLLQPLLGADAFSIENKGLEKFGFSRTKVKSLIRNHFEGELNTGKMIDSLLSLATHLDIRIFTGCEAINIEEKEACVFIKTVTPLNDEPLVFKAAQVAVCTNAFTRALLPDVELKPGRGQVLITGPVADLPFRGIFHFEKGYYYFREINGRILLGGGRNLDFEGETTTTPETTPFIQQQLEDRLHQIILPGKTVNIAARWAGIMAFGAEKYPLIELYKRRIFIGVRLGGMGIAIGSTVGDRLAEIMLEA